MRMKKYLLLVVSTILLGCGTSYQQTAVTPPKASLDADRPVLISEPPDGFYGATQYQGSGRMTAATTRAAFLRFASTADVTSDCHGDRCLESGIASDYGYYVRPDILHWEDRATEWSGIPDKVDIRLTVYDVVSGQEIASQVVAGRSSFWTFGGDHPQDLLREPIIEYVGLLYR